MGLVSTNGENCKRGKITIEIRQVTAEYGNEKKIIFFWGVRFIFVFCLNVAKLFWLFTNELRSFAVYIYKKVRYYRENF